MVPNPAGDPSEPTFVYQQIEQVPPRIALLAGDCLQALRSALDYLVWELVEAAGQKPGRHTAFPVCCKPECFESAKQGALKGSKPEAKAVIERLQPLRSKSPKGEWLYILDELTNMNKHRHLFLTTLGSFSMSGFLDEIDKRYTPGSSAPVTDSRVFTVSQMQRREDLVQFVAFGEEMVKDWDVPIFVEMYIENVSTFVAEFDQFF